MIDPIEPLEPTVDPLQRFEAERMLKNPQFRDIDAFLFMYNRVAELESIVSKLNEVIAEQNGSQN